MNRVFGYGLAIFLLVVGAIMYYAVKPAEAGGIGLHTVGLILMIAGVIAGVLSLVNNYMVSHRSVDRTTSVTDGAGRVSEHNEHVETR